MNIAMNMAYAQIEPKSSYQNESSWSQIKFADWTSDN